MVANPPVVGNHTPLQLAMTQRSNPGPSQQATAAIPVAPVPTQPHPGPDPTAAVRLSGNQSGRSYSLDRIDAVYRGVVDNVNRGRTNEEAFAFVQTKKRTFRTYRNVAGKKV